MFGVLCIALVCMRACCCAAVIGLMCERLRVCFCHRMFIIAGFRASLGDKRYTRYTAICSRASVAIPHGTQNALHLFYAIAQC